MIHMGSFAGVRRFISEQLEAQSVPSLAVAVARGGDILWEEGFGWADRERRIPATEHTIYSLASVSKPFTATALMALCERGLMDLSPPVNHYLGEAAQLTGWAGDAAGATVARLANHTAGLPRHFQFFFEDDPPPYHQPPAMEETIRRYGNIVLPPGETFLYSNLGYGILGCMMERASGQSLGEFLHDAVSEPLGLTHTFVDIGAGGARPCPQDMIAVRYGSDGITLPGYTTDHPGASAVFASVHDLLRFGMFHAGSLAPPAKSVLSPDSRARMQHPLSEGEADQHYGIGWFLGRGITGHPSIAHGGGMDGVSTRLYLIPSEQVVITVLSNTDTELPGRVFREIMLVLFGDSAKQNQQPQKPPGRNVSESPAAAAAAVLPPWIGGRWHGYVHTFRRKVHLALNIASGGSGRGSGARLGDIRADDIPLRDTRWEAGVLTGEFTGDIGTEDAKRLPYRLQLWLRLRRHDGAAVTKDLTGSGAVLNGYVTARSCVEGRLGNALSYWVELTKK